MQTTKSVKAPRKQRKQHFNAPAHKRHKLMSAPLAPDLIASKGVKTIPVRKGDTVRVMRGDHKGFEGKISRVDLKKYHVYIEGLTREKVDGTTIFVSIHPSKVMIKNLNLDDRWRKTVFERKQVSQKKEVKKAPAKVVTKAEKPTEKIAKVPEAKPKVQAKIKEEKPAAATMKPTRAKAKAPASAKEKKQVEKEVVPSEVIKAAEEKAPMPEKAEGEKKTVRKRARAAAKKPLSAAVAKEEEKLSAKEEKVVKKPRAPAKKTAAKKASGKSKAHSEKEGGT